MDAEKLDPDLLLDETDKEVFVKLAQLIGSHKYTTDGVELPGASFAEVLLLTIDQLTEYFSLPIRLKGKSGIPLPLYLDASLQRQIKENILFILNEIFEVSSQSEPDAIDVLVKYLPKVHHFITRCMTTENLEVDKVFLDEFPEKKILIRRKERFRFPDWLTRPYDSMRDKSILNIPLDKGTDWLNEFHRQTLPNLNINQRGKDEVDIQIKVSGDHFRMDEALILISLIYNLLSSIEDTEVQFTEITLGSIVSKIKVFWKSLRGHDQTKEILSNLQKSLVSISDKLNVENELKKSEIKKNESESNFITSQIVRLPNKYISEDLQMLELQIKEEELKKIKLENLKLSAEVMEMARQQILNMEGDIDIIINGISFIRKEKGKIFLGESAEKLIDEPK